MPRFFVFLASVCLLCTAGHAEQFDGRTYQVFDGRSDRSAPAPTVFALHGFLGTGRAMSRSIGLNVVARQHGFVVVYANGLGRRWNDGRDPSAATNDTGYLSGLINHIQAQGLAQADRIYIAGHSNGGGMAMRMACDRPDLIAAIAVVATKVPTNYQCAGGQPVPALFVYGTADRISPHVGRPMGSRLGAALSADQSLELWASRNGCRSVGPGQVIDPDPNDNTRANVYSYRGCSAALWSVIIEGHGHGWPGRNDDIRASALLWQFFSSI